ncbi:uncharacterized protein LY89DRAFT_258873 [Mollisia scopiformis]|uniref:Uncharacterized protein n=1 Tax=Mollisia scopiformis TaxID=149040 RepID=A0A132BD86_MOLSC|nr:uncharacterized protein LY89DRAFT_258873 [Mollisia scopiformis]KUJ10366.1 hypothetical protein LY89DRAFT_258873 [Mollisia scopiformis]
MRQDGRRLAPTSTKCRLTRLDSAAFYSSKTLKIHEPAHFKNFFPAKSETCQDGTSTARAILTNLALYLPAALIESISIVCISHLTDAWSSSEVRDPGSYFLLILLQPRVLPYQDTDRQDLTVFTYNFPSLLKPRSHFCTLRYSSLFLALPFRTATVEVSKIHDTFQCLRCKSILRLSEQL